MSTYSALAIQVQRATDWHCSRLNLEASTSFDVLRTCLGIGRAGLHLSRAASLSSPGIRILPKDAPSPIRLANDNRLSKLLPLGYLKPAMPQVAKAAKHRLL